MSVFEASVHVVCNLCGADDTEIEHEAGRAQRNRIVRCRSCGLMYADPRAFVADHEGYEQQEVQGLLVGVESDRRHRYRWRYEKELGQTRDYDSSRERLNALHPRRGRLLEVGSGLGLLLRRFAADGWEVQGVDPWKEGAAYASGNGIPCAASTLEDAAFPADSFDVVVMLHVIEHAPDPRGTISEIFRVLRPGGHLVIETPRYDTAMYRLAGRRERSISCDGHIFFFTSDTLSELLRSCGFDVVEAEFTGRTLSASRLLWNVGVMSKSRRLSLVLDSVSHRLSLDRVRLRVNLGDMQRFLVERPAPVVDLRSRRDRLDHRDPVKRVSSRRSARRARRTSV